MNLTSLQKTFIGLTMVFMTALLFINYMTCTNNCKIIYSKSNNYNTIYSQSYFKSTFSNIEKWKENVCKRFDQSNSQNSLFNSKDSIEIVRKNEAQSDLTKFSSTSKQSSNNWRARRLPKVIIIGAMKCGTSAIKSMIDMHSAVVARDHETHYFDQYFDHGLDWYLGHMKRSYSDQLTLEKSPSYFRNAAVPSRIYSTNSSMRLILIVKDPTTRSISEYTHHKTHDRCPMSFQETVLRPDGEVEANQPIIMQSMYAHFLENYLEVFPREQILILDGEQLIKDPLPVIKKVEKFLDLKPEISEKNIYLDKDKGFYCMNRNGTIECQDERKGREHVEVDEDTLSKLRAFYAPYNQRFYDLVGQNFGWPTS